MIKQLPMFLACAMLGSTSVINFSPSMDSPAPVATKAEKVCCIKTFCGGSYLGVQIVEVDSTKTNQLGLKETYGALIVKVMDNSPAAKAGLRVNDLIVGFNTMKIDGVNDLIGLVGETPVGNTVHLDVIRAGTPMKLSAVIAKRDGKMFGFIPNYSDSLMQMEMQLELGSLGKQLEGMQNDSSMHLMRELELGMLGKHLKGLGPKCDSMGIKIDQMGQDLERMLVLRRPRLGVELQNLTPQLAKYFGAGVDAGALVSNVVENSPAAKGGLQAGDVITAIDAQKVKSPEDAMRIIGGKPAGEIVLTILRDKREQTIRVTLENPKSRNGNDPSRMLEGAVPPRIE